jgi:hypothetical protein
MVGRNLEKIGNNQKANRGKTGIEVAVILVIEYLILKFFSDFEIADSKLMELWVHISR